MHDLKIIRENPQLFDAALARRGASPVAANIVALDERRRAVQTALQEGQARRNEASKAIGAAMGKGDMATADQLKSEVAALKDQLPQLEEQDKALGEELHGLLAALPNLPLMKKIMSSCQHGVKSQSLILRRPNIAILDLLWVLILKPAWQWRVRVLLSCGDRSHG
jgi:seryl-tRNA synthetase